MPMASSMLTAASNAIGAFAHTMLRPEKDANGRCCRRGGAAGHRAGQSRRIAQINADLCDMLAASLARGVFLGALVVETGPDPRRTGCRSCRR